MILIHVEFRSLHLAARFVHDVVEMKRLRELNEVQVVWVGRKSSELYLITMCSPLRPRDVEQIASRSAGFITKLGFQPKRAS